MLTAPVFGFEVFLERIPPAKARATKTRAALDAAELLPLTRDFAFVVDEDVAAEALVRAVAPAPKNR